MVLWASLSGPLAPSDPDFLDFEFALGGALVGPWEADLGFKILPKTIAFTPLNISPGYLQNHRVMKLFGFWILTHGS